MIMKSIIFKDLHNAYLPEVYAYVDYLKQNEPSWNPYLASEIGTFSAEAFDVIWEFMGLDLHKKNSFVVHEYNSSSTGYFYQPKNIIKSIFNTTPNRRVFLNQEVQSKFIFKNDIPFNFRPMGIHKKFLNSKENTLKSYDFVYVGSVEGRERPISKVLYHITQNLPRSKLLFIGGVSNSIHQTFKDAQNITFSGKVPYLEVCDLLKRAKYGLNLIPDVYPQNSQDSTKLLEYCALGLKIISSNYSWVRNFEKTRKAKFFFLNENLENFKTEQIASFDFKTPSVEDLEWQKVIKRSNVFDFLRKI